MNIINDSLCGKAFKLILDSDYRFEILAGLGLYKKMGDEEYLKRMFKARMGYELDLNNPITFNEKMQWLKLFDRNPEYTAMVDKYEVKQYVARIVGDKYIIPTLGVWDSFDQINFDSLPNQFVLKCTHDSGGVSICKDKNKFNIRRAKRKINNCLKRNFYYYAREWPYKNVKPRVIAERFIQSSNGAGLRDYKFFCFNGAPKFLYISEGLENHSTASISFFDFNGKQLQFSRKDYKPFSCNTIELPDNFDKMIEIAQILCKSTTSNFSRIDLYNIEGTILFSEITFSPCAGFIPFEPEHYDEVIGNLLSLD